jgi:hypothetical protein
MHEVELGLLKGLIIHLVRMLHSVKGSPVQVFDERYVHNCLSDVKINIGI